MTELAAIVARDAEWAEQPDGSLAYTWINVRSGEPRIAPHATDPDGPADRRALLALLRPIGNWFATTHGNELDHDHHCRGAEPCVCGWAEAAPALDAISFIDDPVPA